MISHGTVIGPPEEFVVHLGFLCFGLDSQVFLTRHVVRCKPKDQSHTVWPISSS